MQIIVNIIKGIIRLPISLLLFLIFAILAGIFMPLSLLEGLGSRKEFYKTEIFKFVQKIDKKINIF